MPSTGTYRVNSPANGTEYIAPSSLWVIPNSGTNVTVQVDSYNSSGVHTTVGNLTVYLRNVTSSNNTGSFNGGTAFSTSFGPAGSGVTNGSRVFTVAASCSGGIDHIIMQVTNYTGRLYSQISVRRSGSWTTISPQIRRSGAWNACSVYVRRSGSWQQIA